MYKIIITTLLLALSITLVGCNNKKSEEVSTSQNNLDKSGEYVIDESDFIKENELIEDIQKTFIDKDEKEGLILMREEEKLARDVYKTLYEKWNLNIFSNIADSEQTHTDAVKSLLDRYNIEDPVKDNSIGSFTSPDMKKLYNDLVSQGESSLLDALKVGATIEDLDIKDLKDLLLKTDNEDIILTYNNLQKGSRNHLRAYINQIKRNNGDYSPQYISEEEFEEIISSSQEKGREK